MLKVYGDERSGNCYKVKLLLNLLQQDYQWQAVDVLKGETRSAEFLAKNPNGKIPLLELEDGSFLWESNAILNYLADGTAWIPHEPRLRTQCFKSEPSTSSVDEVILAQNLCSIIQHRFATIDAFITDHTCYSEVQRNVFTSIAQKEETVTAFGSISFLRYAEVFVVVVLVGVFQCPKLIVPVFTVHGHSNIEVIIITNFIFGYYTCTYFQSFLFWEHSLCLCNRDGHQDEHHGIDILFHIIGLKCY